MDNFVISRRKFVSITSRGALAAFTIPALGAAFFSKQTWAETIEPDLKEILLGDVSQNPPHFFVYVRAENGMDVTLGLDPQFYYEGSELDDQGFRALNPGVGEKAIFLGYKKSEILRPRGTRLQFGPSAAPLVPHAKDIAVINGVDMGSSSVDHFAANRYISSGVFGEQTASIAVELTHSTLHGPLGILHDDTSLELGQRSNISPTRWSSVTQQLNNSPYSEILEAISLEDDNGTFAKAARDWNQSQRQLLLIARDVERASKSKDPLFAVIATIFSLGVSRHAQINLLADDVDTHSSHATRHPNGQCNGVWERVHQLFTSFKSIPFGKSTLFDYTTFYVANEFSRTPALNDSNGKDHNPRTNSVLLAGKGIAGGVSVGGSHVVPPKRFSSKISEHIGNAINFRTGEVRVGEQPGFESLRPEHIIRTIARVYGDPPAFRTVNLKSLPVIPGILTS